MATKYETKEGETKGENSHLLAKGEAKDNSLLDLTV
jgi:hypothetical protein